MEIPKQRFHPGVFLSRELSPSLYRVMDCLSELRCDQATEAVETMDGLDRSNWYMLPIWENPS